MGRITALPSGEAVAFNTLFRVVVKVGSGRACDGEYEQMNWSGSGGQGSREGQTPVNVLYTLVI